MYSASLATLKFHQRAERSSVDGWSTSIFAANEKFLGYKRLSINHLLRLRLPNCSMYDPISFLRRSSFVLSERRLDLDCKGNVHIPTLSSSE